jgi:hypothetical protein
MSGPNEPQYPQDWGPYQYQQYPQVHAYPGPPPAPRPRLVDRLQYRLVERPVPRLGVSLAGIGVALAVAGVIAWGSSYISEGGAAPVLDASGGGGGSTSRHFLGALLALVVVATGYALLIGVRRGPLATAGIAASALGVPVAMEFLTYESTSSNPINLDAVVWVSIVVYVFSYLFVRGARGHTFYVGTSLLVLWVYLLDKAAPSAADFAGSAFFRLVPGSEELGISRAPNVSTLAGVSLVIGSAYYLIGWWLDRSGRRGLAVGFVLVGFPAVATGVAALGPDLKQVGTGIALLVVSLSLALYGARWNRRFTTWVWTVGAAVGAVLIVAKIVGSATGAAIGISLIVLGAAFVVGGTLLARALREPDDVLVRAEPA